MRLVVGLGNPGARYHRTRHNVGFRVVDVLAARVSGLAGRERAGAWVAETRIAGGPVLLVKPLSFMNLSGVPVARLLVAHDAVPSDLIVVLDDAALELGSIRVRERGGHGGHNGLRSLVEQLETEDFPRVRVGIGKGELPEDLTEWVLSDFPDEDRALVEEVEGRAADAVTCLVAEGAAAAANRFNRRPD